MPERLDCLRIVDWEREYEVREGSRPWREGQPRNRGPLSFYRSKVRAGDHSTSYRVMLTLAGNGNSAATFGVFHKLLEIAADQEADVRGLILYKHKFPATPEHIAAMTGFPVETVQLAIDLLLNPDVHWIEWVMVTVGDDGRVAVGALVPPVSPQSTEGQPLSPLQRVALTNALHRSCPDLSPKCRSAVANFLETTPLTVSESAAFRTLIERSSAKDNPAAYFRAGFEAFCKERGYEQGA